MQVERPHAQIRRVHKLEVGTPLITPSFSSRRFPYVSDIWEELRHKLYGICLVSAFDIAGGHIPAGAADMVNVVILDSGPYEANNQCMERNGSDAPESSVNWTREQYREVVKSISDRDNILLVNFDHVGCMEDQIGGATEDFSLLSHIASDFLVKPLDGAQGVNIPRLGRHLEALEQFDVIGITAREVGNSFLNRCSSIVMLRDLLNDASLDMPIHVFGAINPYEVLAYFGLNWLRLAYRRHGSIPIDELAMEELKWNLTEMDLQTSAWTGNLGFLYWLQAAMQRYATNGDLQSLVEEFPIARRAAHIAEIAGAEIQR